jgi:hypothetical protein
VRDGAAENQSLRVARAGNGASRICAFISRSVLATLVVQSGGVGILLSGATKRKLLGTCFIPTFS